MKSHTFLSSKYPHTAHDVFSFGIRLYCLHRCFHFIDAVNKTASVQQSNEKSLNSCNCLRTFHVLCSSSQKNLIMCHRIQSVSNYINNENWAPKKQPIKSEWKWSAFVSSLRFDCEWYYSRITLGIIPVSRAYIQPFHFDWNLCATIFKSHRKLVCTSFFNGKTIQQQKQHVRFWVEKYIAEICNQN